MAPSPPSLLPAVPPAVSADGTKSRGWDLLPSPIPARALNGHRLVSITYQTQPVMIILSGNHHEQIQFHILPLILGLRRHNPHIGLKTGTTWEWGAAPSNQTPSISVDSSDLVGVPPVYHNLYQVFREVKATSLPRY